MELNDVIYNSVIITAVLLIFIGLYFYRKYNDVEKSFANYIIVAGIFELIALGSMELYSSGHLASWGIKNTLPGLHLFTLAQFVLLSIFFKKLLKLFDLIIPLQIILPVGILLIIANTFLFQGIFEFNSYNKSIVELYLIILCFIYFFKTLTKVELDNGMKHLSLFVTAVFINAAISIMVHLFSVELWNFSSELMTKLWILRALVNLITQFIILFGLYFIYKRISNSVNLINNA